MEQPQEIEDEDYERTWDRVAAVDVAKATGVVCTRVPDEERPGRRLTRIWTVQATMAGVTELGDHLRCQGIEVVTIESTSDYWRIWHVVLEDAGLRVQLVNALGEERAGAGQDRQEGRRVAGQADRAGHAPAVVHPAA